MDGELLRKRVRHREGFLLQPPRHLGRVQHSSEQHYRSRARGLCVPERYLLVSWVRLDAVSPEVGSLALIREITSQREQAEAREEEVAIVAHELRTPLAALKNSLAIVRGARAGNARRRRPARTGLPLERRQDGRQARQARRQARRIVVGAPRRAAAQDRVARRTGDSSTKSPAVRSPDAK